MAPKKANEIKSSRKKGLLIILNINEKKSQIQTKATIGLDGKIGIAVWREKSFTDMVVTEAKL